MYFCIIGDISDVQLSFLNSVYYTMMYLSGWDVCSGSSSFLQFIRFLIFFASRIYFSLHILFFFHLWNHLIVLFLNVWLAFEIRMAAAAAPIAWRRRRWCWWCVECRRTEIMMNWYLGTVYIVHVFCVFRISWRDDYDDFVIAGKCLYMSKCLMWTQWLAILDVYHSEESINHSNESI